MKTEAQTKGLHVVVGLGKTGLSVLRYLKAQEIPAAVVDSRTTPPSVEIFQRDFPNTPHVFGAFDEAILRNARRIVLSPGVSPRQSVIQSAIDRGIPVIGDIELFAQAIHAPVVAITGTNAKSTVTTLVGEMAKRTGRRTQVGGNLGTPILDLLQHTELSASANQTLYVLELSSFQLETTESLLPRAAAILNISPDHLDRYDTFESYVAAKQRIYRNSAVTVWNRHDPLTRPQTLTESITFGLDEPGEGMFGLRTFHHELYLAYGQERLLPTSALALQGEHHWLNALAALALGHSIELPMDAMLKTLQLFQGLPHRCQRVRELDGVSWYNDSKATNVGASCAAISGLRSQVSGRIILLAGGQGKGADFTVLADAIDEKVSHALVFGEDAVSLAEALSGSTEVVRVADLAEAVSRARAIAKPGDAVLLAPACASFDMFRDFNHRGEVFTQFVESLS